MDKNSNLNQKNYYINGKKGTLIDSLREEIYGLKKSNKKT